VYSKYFKMLKVGLPKETVKAKMKQEGADPDMLDKAPTDKITLENPTNTSTANEVALEEHPVYSKYFKMLKMGLPKEAVKAKMKQEGADPDMLDKAPSEKISESVKLEPKSVEKKKQIAKVRKKKLHWQPLDRSRLSTNSLWFDDDNEDDVALDEDEFRQLFEERYKCCGHNVL